MCLGVSCADWVLVVMLIGVSDATLVMALEYGSPLLISLVRCCWGGSAYNGWVVVSLSLGLSDNVPWSL